jgi:hypothetical protein
MLQFACPHCQAVLQTPDELAGSVAACYRCGQQFQIPATLQPAPAPAPEPVAAHCDSSTDNDHDELAYHGASDDSEPAAVAPALRRGSEEGGSGTLIGIGVLVLISLSCFAIAGLWLAFRPVPEAVVREVSRPQVHREVVKKTNYVIRSSSGPRTKGGTGGADDAPEMVEKAETEPEKTATEERKRDPEQEKREAEAKAAETAKKAEKAAAAKLGLVKQLADDPAKVDTVRQRLKELIGQFPDTNAAVEAREMLKKIGKD